MSEDAGIRDIRQALDEAIENTDPDWVQKILDAPEGK